MARLKIKQLDERVATSGVHLGGGPERRKLHPGEVIDIPEDFEDGQHAGKSLFEAVWETGKVELTHDPVTRPIDFRDEREGKLTAPTFRSRGPDDDRAIAEAKSAVAERLAATERPSETAPADPPPEPEAKNRRAQKRIAARKRSDGQEAAA